MNHVHVVQTFHWAFEVVIDKIALLIYYIHRAKAQKLFTHICLVSTVYAWWCTVCVFSLRARDSLSANNLAMKHLQFFLKSIRSSCTLKLNNKHKKENKYCINNFKAPLSARSTSASLTCFSHKTPKENLQRSTAMHYYVFFFFDPIIIKYIKIVWIFFFTLIFLL